MVLAFQLHGDNFADLICMMFGNVQEIAKAQQAHSSEVRGRIRALVSGDNHERMARKELNEDECVYLKAHHFPLL